MAGLLVAREQAEAADRREAWEGVWHQASRKKLAAWLKTVVRAAGGVVWRRATDGEAEILLVHRPKYDDWTFPKGKCDAGEDDETCARREVEEETGLLCELGAELPSTEYIDPKGRPKVVRYWAMIAAKWNVLVERRGRRGAMVAPRRCAGEPELRRGTVGCWRPWPNGSEPAQRDQSKNLLASFTFRSPNPPLVATEPP